MNVGVAEAVVLLEASDEDRVGRGLAHEVTVLRYARVFNPDVVKELEKVRITD